MDLDVSWRPTENIYHMVKNWVGRTDPVVIHQLRYALGQTYEWGIDKIQVIGHGFREHIRASRIQLTCLIPGYINPTNGMTKSKPDRFLADSIRTKKLKAQQKRVFIL